MYFQNTEFLKTSFLELSIHIAGDNECTMWHSSSDLFENAEAGMRHRIPIQLKTVTIEAPS